MLVWWVCLGVNHSTFTEFSKLVAEWIRLSRFVFTNLSATKDTAELIRNQKTTSNRKDAGENQKGGLK